MIAQIRRLLCQWFGHVEAVEEHGFRPKDDGRVRYRAVCRRCGAFLWWVNR